MNSAGTRPGILGDASGRDRGRVSVWPRGRASRSAICSHRDGTPAGERHGLRSFGVIAALAPGRWSSAAWSSARPAGRVSIDERRHLVRRARLAGGATRRGLRPGTLAQGAGGPRPGVSPELIRARRRVRTSRRESSSTGRWRRPLVGRGISPGLSSTWRTTSSRRDSGANRPFGRSAASSVSPADLLRSACGRANPRRRAQACGAGSSLRAGGPTRQRAETVDSTSRLITETFAPAAVLSAGCSSAIFTDVPNVGGPGPCHRRGDVCCMGERTLNGAGCGRVARGRSGVEASDPADPRRSGSRRRSSRVTLTRRAGRRAGPSLLRAGGSALKLRSKAADAFWLPVAV